MSTDIVHWNKSGNAKTYRSSALRVYLAISLPFMVVTFAVWYGFHHFEKRKDEQRHEKNRQEQNLA